MHLFIFLGIGSIALFSFLAVATWSGERRREREAYYRAETVKRLAELQGAGGQSAVEVLREEQRLEGIRKIEGIKLGGLITLAIGIGLTAFLAAMMSANQTHEPAYLVGLIPGLIGVALLVYAYVLAPLAPKP